MKYAISLILFFAWLTATAEQYQQVIDLWPDGAPESQQTPTEVAITERGDPDRVRDRYAEFITEPNLVVFQPAKPNGQALLVVPGGGYERVVMDKEGYEVAEWFGKRGVTCFVLMYRLPKDGWTNRWNVSLQDAQRAMRVLRANAASYGIDPARIGVIGFSAGGHVAGSLAILFDREVYAAVDTADEFSARPDFAMLVYPVVSMDPEIAHAGSRQRLLGANPPPAMERMYSLELNVMPSTPPSFILHAEDDKSVVVQNSLRLHAAMQAADVPVDLHVFSEGGHGFGLRYATDKPVFEWPQLAWRWMQSR